MFDSFFKSKKSIDINFNSTKISFKCLGDLHIEAKHSISGSVIYPDAPKDQD